MIDKIKEVKPEYIFLLIFVLFGFYLRAYHLDFPPIGYHNMKETEYLDMAYHYYEGPDNFVDYFRRQLFRTNADNPKAYFEEYPQMPLIPWASAFLWLIFGVHVWLSRLIIVLFSLGAVVGVYFLANKLTQNKYFSLTSAFIMTILPLGVFFGRNVQPEAPALCMMVWGMYFFANWTETRTNKDIILCGIALCLCANFKPTFLIGVIPLLAVFPWNLLKLQKSPETNKVIVTEEQKSVIKQVGIFAICMLPYLIWNFIISGMLNTTSSLTAGTFSRVNLLRIFGEGYWADFWPTIDAYIRDNYAVYFWYFAILGLVFCVLRNKTTISRFILLYALAIIPYLMILADYFKGHSYYQMPFLPLIAMASAYFIVNLGELLRAFVKLPLIKYAPLIIIPLFFPVWANVQQYTNVQYDTIFYGLDVAGQFFAKNLAKDDWFGMAGHSQSVAVGFEAKRTHVGVGNLPDLIQAENEHNVKYYFVHGPYGLQTFQENPKLWAYMQANWSFAQLGCIKVQEQCDPRNTYYILKKGGPLDDKVFQNKPMVLAKTYDSKMSGDQKFYTIDA